MGALTQCVLGHWVFCQCPSTHCSRASMCVRAPRGSFACIPGMPCVPGVLCFTGKVCVGISGCRRKRTILQRDSHCTGAVGGLTGYH